MSSPLKDSLSDIPLLPKDLATDVQKLSLSQTPKSFTFKQNQEAARVPVESTAQNLASPGASSSVARQQTSSQSPQAPRKVSLSHVHTSLRAALGSNNSPPKYVPRSPSPHSLYERITRHGPYPLSFSPYCPSHPKSPTANIHPQQVDDDKQRHRQPRPEPDKMAQHMPTHIQRRTRQMPRTQ